MRAVQPSRAGGLQLTGTHYLPAFQEKQIFNLMGLEIKCKQIQWLNRDRGRGWQTYIKQAEQITDNKGGGYIVKLRMEALAV